MGRQSLGNQDVFERLAFFCDLQITVPLCSLEVVMHGDHVLIHAGRLEFYFFRQY